MKQTITLSIAAICFVISAHAQINKGSILLGGTIYGSSSNSESADSSISKSNYVTIAPALGFAVSTNTILGFSLSYGNNDYKYSGNAFEQKYHSYGAGVFLRQYKVLGKNFYLFGEGNLMYYHSSYNYSVHDVYAEYDSKGNTVALSVTPGLAYNLTRSIQLETGLQNLLYISYGTNNETPKDAAADPYKQTNFSVGTSLNPVSFSGIFVGIRFLLNSSQKK